MSQKQTIDISYESIFRVVLVLLVLFLLFYLRQIIFIVFISVIAALIMNPAVEKMKEKKIPRAVGASILFLAVLAMIGLFFYIIVPPLAKELGQLATQIPVYMNSMNIDYSIISEQKIDDRLAGPIQEILVEASKFLKNTTTAIFSGVFGLLGGILSAVLIAVVSFYLVIEKKGIEKFVKAVIPFDFQPRALKVIKKIEVKLGKWFIAQLFLGFAIGLVTFIGLSLLGVPYAMVLAIIAGGMELIPYLGPTLAAIPAVIIAFSVSPFLALLTLILYFLIQEVENYVLVPKVMQKSVGLHPVIIIIAILIGYQFAGIIGVILSVPVATIASIILEDLYGSKH
ncbi:MAG: AI-2E family transporter [Patescibacteria group bacterium]|nr:AI-2E family transporter [Patescibacteria group bacterium]